MKYTPTVVREYTTAFDLTYEEANLIAYCWSHGLCTSGIPLTLADYNTAVKGEPEDINFPDECWAVTNKFDPRVVKDNNYNGGGA